MNHRQRIASINEAARIKHTTPSTRWAAVHCDAFEVPANHTTAALVNMIHGAALYADAHETLYHSKLGDDGVLGPAWVKIVEGLRELLNGEIRPLDGGTTDSILCSMLSAEGLLTE